MRGAWWSAVLLMGGVAAAQQAGAPPAMPTPEPQKQCSYTVTDASGDKVTGTRNCAGGGQAPADTPAAKRFPYPGEAGAMDAPQPKETPEAQKEAPAGNRQEPAAKRFPFPGDASGEGLKDAGSSGESSSSGRTSGAAAGESSSSADTAGMPSPDDVNSDTPPAPKRGMHKKPEPPPKNVADQESEDLQVAGFYMNDRNWRGAYGRAQDAVKLVGEDADAHLALAEAARKLGKLDEAEREYKRTLQLDPVPKTRKVAERALKEMTGGGS